MSASHVCWNCGAAVPDGALFCPSCNSLQEPTRDFYRILGLEPRLALDSDDLQTRFYQLSRQIHPDRFARKPERERQYSLDTSSVLNDAYRTLRDPVKRAQYLLSQQGFDIGEQRSKDVPPELLEEVFELNEALEELRGGDDSARDQLAASENNFRALLGEIDSELDRLARAYDAAPSQDTLSKIRGVLNRRKYIQNLLNEVGSALAPAG